MRLMPEKGGALAPKVNRPSILTSLMLKSILTKVLNRLRVPDWSDLDDEFELRSPFTIWAKHEELDLYSETAASNLCSLVGRRQHRIDTMQDGEVSTDLPHEVRLAAAYEFIQKAKAVAGVELVAEHFLKIVGAKRIRKGPQFVTHAFLRAIVTYRGAQEGTRPSSQSWYRDGCIIAYCQRTKISPSDLVSKLGASGESLSDWYERQLAFLASAKEKLEGSRLAPGKTSLGTRAASTSSWKIVVSQGGQLPQSEKVIRSLDIHTAAEKQALKSLLDLLDSKQQKRPRRPEAILKDFRRISEVKRRS